MPSSDTSKQLNNIQRRDAFDKFSLLLQKFPALSEVASAKKVKKEPLEWGDFQNIWRNDPTFPFEEAWDAYEKAYLITNNNSSAEKNSDTEGDDKQKGGKEEDEEDYYPGAAEDAGEDEKYEKNNEEEDGEKDKDAENGDGEINKFNASGLNAESREKLLKEMRGVARSTAPKPNTQAGNTSRPPHHINPAPQAIVGRRYTNRAGDEKGGVRIPGVGRYGRRLGKKIAKKGISKVLGRKLTQQIATRLASIVARLSLSSPHGMVITAVVLVVIFLIILIAFLFFKSTSYDFGEEETPPALPPATGGEAGEGANPIPGLTLSKTAESESVENGEQVTYTIRAEYSGDGDVFVYDPIAQNAEYFSSTGSPEYDEVDRVLTWRLNEKEPIETEGDTKIYSFNVTLTPVVPDSFLINQAFAYAAGPVGENAPEGGVKPNAETCSGFYSLENPYQLNFGDPVCEYANNEVQFKDDLYSLLKELDPVNADFWFNQVIPCESSYNPNTYYLTGAAGDTPDSGGAWGLFQMGSKYGAEMEPPQGNGSLDRGDVPWRQQVKNATSYFLENMGGKNMGRYWACARPEFF